MSGWSCRWVACLDTIPLITSKYSPPLATRIPIRPPIEVNPEGYCTAFAKRNFRPISIGNDLLFLTWGGSYHCHDHRCRNWRSNITCIVENLLWELILLHKINKNIIQLLHLIVLLLGDTLGWEQTQWEGKTIICKNEDGKKIPIFSMDSSSQQRFNQYINVAIFIW